MIEKQNIKETLVMPCEVYSRVVGYYRPAQYWNIGKKQEFRDRKYFLKEGINDKF